MPVTKDTVEAIIRTELAEYLKRDDVKEMLERMERNKQKRELWNSLSLHKKLEVLRYMAERKGSNEQI
jgi:Mg/Co/Ni transporter MgtE